MPARKNKRTPGRFGVWAEYKDSSGDLDIWLMHASRGVATGSGTALWNNERDVSFEADTKAQAISMGRRLAAVLKLARRDGGWHVYVVDYYSREKESHEAKKIWKAGKISDPPLLRVGKRKKRKK